MSLLDSLSRLSLSTDDIFTTANRTIADVGPFTDAVLGQHLITDIIRDAEEGEQTLFTHRTADSAGVRRGVDVRPVPVSVSVGAVGTGVGRALGGAGIEREVDVDVLLGAALRIVESYGSMPRARGHIEQLHDRAAEVRSRISLLEDELDELKTASSALPAEPTEPEPSLKDEEISVVRFEAQLAAARRKRDTLRDQLQSKKRARTLHNTGHTISTPTAAARTRTRPGAAAAAVNSKIPNPFSRKLSSVADPDSTTNISVHLTGGTSESLVDEGPPAWADDSILSNTTHVVEEDDQEEEGGERAIPGDSIWEKDDDEDVGADEATVVLAIPPAVEYSPPPSPARGAGTVAPPLRARSSAASVVVSELAPVPVAAPAPAPAPTPAIAPVKPPAEVKSKPAPQDTKADVKVTPEMEVNTALIWSTVGKVIAPSSNYGTDSPTPGAAETISILQSLASQCFANAPSSPSSASTLQGIAEPAPAQTILTATLLLYLLREGPSPLPAVRSALAEKEGESAAGLGIKALYACVAKKLLKIDRKGREATVRFE
ncbi:hypothetical protein FRC06_009544 [Ceratobasidium sp. 370]|nr:hypothetical protein FRC06_009544 [Ceratobasidium sp. 370]